MPTEGGDKKTKQPREIASEFVRTRNKVAETLGGEKYNAMKSMQEKGVDPKSKAYKKAEREAKAELSSKYSNAFGVKNKKAYTASEKKKALKAALELAQQKGRGGIGRDGRAQMKATLLASKADAVRIFGKKGAYKLERALTRTDKGGGKVRKTNKRAYETVQKVREISVDSKGRTIVKTFDAGARKVRYFDASKPLPKGVGPAVRRWEAANKGALGRRSEAKPMLGEAGYKGAPNLAKGRGAKPAAAKPKNPKSKKAQSKNFEKKAPAKQAKPKKEAATTKPKKEAPTAKPKKEATKPAPAKKETPVVRRTAEADRLIAASKARKEAANKAAPAAKPAAPAKPAAAPKKEAPAKRTTADTTLEPQRISIKPVKLVDSGVKNPPSKGNTSPARKKVVEANLKNQKILADKVKKDGIESLTQADRSTFSFLTRTKGDFERELKSTKWKK
jgi:hypothetical protein